MDIQKILFEFSKQSYEIKIAVKCYTEKESLDFLNLISTALGYDFSEDLLKRHIKSVGLPVFFYGRGTVAPEFAFNEEVNDFQVINFKDVLLGYKVELI